MSENDESPKNTRIRGPWSIGAGTVLVDQERVLLVRNRYGITKGRYLLPAGRVNIGELPDRAAERETLEETGLHVQVTGLLGVRIVAQADGEHNYFFMFAATLLSPASELRPNLDEVDDARFFSRAELAALDPDETWAGAIAIAYKVLDGQANVWPNDAGLSSDSGVDTSERWRMWM